MRARILALAALAAIGTGVVLWLLDASRAADLVWGAGALVVLVPLTVDTARSLRKGDVGVDAIALVAIAGSLVLGEELAGVIVALMMSGGEALEDWAAGRARRELRLLVERAPRTAHRYVEGAVEDVPVEQLVPGDRVVVLAGEVVPADGDVSGADAVVDESALTGEPLPVTLGHGRPVRSGTTNVGNAFDLMVRRPAAESAYAGIIRLVRESESDRARFTRLADRYAAWFLPFTVVLAGIGWGISGDPRRALAVFVVATPCPLILAAPIAFVAGLSRAARAGVIVKGAGALERLGSARTVLFDKTGTITSGEPEIDRVVPVGRAGADESLRLAASLDQMSVHVLAASLVAGARSAGLELSLPAEVREAPGQGITGVVEGRQVAVGSNAWLERRGYHGGRAASAAIDETDGAVGQAKVLVGVDGLLEAIVLIGDRLRPGAAGAVAELRRIGIEHIAMVTGDHAEIAEDVALSVGIDEVYADCTPERKLDVVRSMRDLPGRRAVVMVGDGINDAPALALADVGIAIAGKGATISSETADAVIVVDQADRIPLAIRTGRRSLSIARQSVAVGLGLSIAAMVVAAAGYLPPVAGALFQEVIDVAVILNALRALRD